MTMRCAWCGYSHRQMYGERGAYPQACINYLLGKLADADDLLKALEATWAYFTDESSLSLGEVRGLTVAAIARAEGLE